MEKLEFIDEYQSQIMRTRKRKLIFLRIHLMRQVKKLFMSL